VTSTLFLDIENDGPRLLTVQAAHDNEPPYVMTGSELALVKHPVQVGYNFLRLLADPGVTKVTQGDHDLRHFLMHEGWEVAGPWHNTMVMAWVLDENQPLDLESLTRKYTPTQVKKKAITSRGNRLYFKERWPLDEFDQWSDAVKWQFTEYGVWDIVTLRSLYTGLGRELHRGEWLDYWQTEEVPYSSLLLRMETRGLPVDLDATRVLADEVRLLRDESAAVLRAEGGLPAAFNLNSPDQIREYLFSRFCSLPGSLPMDTDPLPSDQDFEVTKVGRTVLHGNWLFKGRGLAPTPPPRQKGKGESGQPSTDSKELLYKHGSDPWVHRLCTEYRRHQTLLQSFLDKWPKVAVTEEKHWGGCAWPEEGCCCPASKGARLYTHFNQTGTVTGRLSSSDPVNLQNIPARREMGKRVRALFRGNFVIGDYDALEMRIMASLSGDPKLIKVFEDGVDPHEATARIIFGACDGHDDPRRDQGKTVNYAVGYGAGAKTLAKSLSLAGFPTTQSEAKEYQLLVAGQYRRLYSWMNRQIWQAKDLGYVETIGGRQRRILHHADEDWTAKSYGERQAVNAIIQGSAADILRRVMLAVDTLPLSFGGLRLLAQVHDELIWEYDLEPDAKALAALQAICEEGHGFDLRVPLVFVPKVCEGWDEK
jgi:DNA polymerase I-like protein with 3'-5' exonuclease and polymerase domains